MAAKDPHPRQQKNRLRGQSQGEHQVPKPPPVARSISNKERGGPPSTSKKTQKNRLRGQTTRSPKHPPFKVLSHCKALGRILNTMERRFYKTDFPSFPGERRRGGCFGLSSGKLVNCYVVSVCHGRPIHSTCWYARSINVGHFDS